MRSDKLREVERDLQNLLDFCNKQGMSKSEMRRVFSPIMKKSRANKTIAILVLVICVLWLLAKTECFSWHFSAIGRIVMIKLLDVYDWRWMKNTRGCLLKRRTQGGDLPECYHCEGLKTVRFTRSADAIYLKEMFLDVDHPVIVPYNSTLGPDLPRIFDAIDAHDAYAESAPCKFASSVMNARKARSVRAILAKARKHGTFFAHFQNCDFDAVKRFRRVIPRPEFLHPEFAPVQYSWILTSGDYDAGAFKALRLSDHLTTVVQIAGSNAFTLQPYWGCSDDCPQLRGELYAGEALIFTSKWDFAYKPEPASENFAVILETH